MNKAVPHNGPVAALGPVNNLLGLIGNETETFMKPHEIPGIEGIVLHISCGARHSAVATST